jgi:hypothetical protein
MVLSALLSGMSIRDDNAVLLFFCRYMNVLSISCLTYTIIS